MFSLFKLISLTAVSALIAFYDFKQRQVPVWTLSIFTLFLLIEAIDNVKLSNLFPLVGYNLCFIAIQAGALFLYYFLRYKSFEKLQNSIGGADIWLILSLCLSFSTVNFILFITLSLCLSLLLFLVYLIVSQSRNHHIPLAGFVALWYVISKIFMYFYNPQIQWDDTWIMSKLGYY